MAHVSAVTRIATLWWFHDAISLQSILGHCQSDLSYTAQLKMALVYVITMQFSTPWMYSSVVKHSPSYTPSAATKLSLYSMFRSVVHSNLTPPDNFVKIAPFRRQCTKNSYIIIMQHYFAKEQV